MSMNPRTLRPGGTFTPRSISGLALWLDASDGATLFQNSDGTVPATASSDPVGYWGDKSGNGRHAVQATAANRGAISATNQGGRKALAFNATTKNMVSPATVAQYVADATTSPKMFFAWVARPEGGAASTIFGSPSHPNSASRVFFANDYGAAGSHIVDFGAIGDPGGRLTGVVGNEAENVGHVYSAFRDGAVMSVRRDGVEILRKTNASGVFSVTTGTLSINTCDGGSGMASWMEFMAYAASMSASNITRIERYLAARWGITLAPQVANADAQDWINRVYSNGGTVSSATASAVNSLCDSLESESLRDRFYRLNLFCGSNLNAALVPLYRGPSLGSPYGGATDTNNAFASGDYSESLGILGNGTNYLGTGLAPSALPLAATNHHVAGWKGAGTLANQRMMIGALAGDTSNLYRVGKNGGTSGSLFSEIGLTAGATSASVADNDTAGLLIGSRTSATLLELMWKGSIAATLTTSVTPVPVINAYDVFAQSPGHNGNWLLRMGGYSIGAGLTSTQAAAYNTAMTTFQAALGRA